MRLSILVLCALGALPLAAPAQERATLGIGRLLSNDYLGDGHDRWRSSAYSFSLLRGRVWEGAPPSQPGAIVEYRLRTEVFAPGRLSGEGSDDRPFGAGLSFGVLSHWSALGGEVSAGAEATVTGPQTGFGDLIDEAHEYIGAPRPSQEVLDAQVGDGVHPSASLAYVRPFRASPVLTLRPFAEGQVGVEEIVRFGGDVILGQVGHDDLWLRDVSSGQLYRGVQAPRRGLSLVAGADWARVGDSLWLPEDQGVEAEDERLRVRAALHANITPRSSIIYGLTYHSPEFVGQDEGQLTGQVKLALRF